MEGLQLFYLTLRTVDTSSGKSDSREPPYDRERMCGIAGYSLSASSSVDRTLAAQSLLAGIAERGADAVGYAYRGPEEAYPVVTKQRTPASLLLERISVPAICPTSRPSFSASAM